MPEPRVALGLVRPNGLGDFGVAAKMNGFLVFRPRLLMAVLFKIDFKQGTNGQMFGLLPVLNRQKLLHAQNRPIGQYNYYFKLAFNQLHQLQSTTMALAIASREWYQSRGLITFLRLCQFQMQLDKVTPDEEVRSILHLMKESKIYWGAKREIINLVLKNRTNTAPSLEQLYRAMLLSGNEDKLNGLINNCLQKSTRRLPIERDTNPEIQFYRVKWSQMITKQFNSMSNKIAREEQYDEEDESVTYVYDCSSLLQFLSSIKIKNTVAVRDSTIFLFPSETIKTTKYTQLKQKYSFLSNPENIIGSDMDNDLRDREKKARRIVQGENISIQIESFLCLGCTNGDRVNVYRRYFECFYEYTGKRVEFALYQKIWKHMIKSDSKEILKNPVFFVFKEAILKVYETFICDKQLGQMVKIRQSSPIETKFDKYAPIHGNLPSKCFANYIAPFCYTSTSPEQTYQLFRHVYANYLCLLNTVSSLPDSILGLCVLFQDLLWSTEKKLVAKFEELQIQPLRIVFPWMFYCFIGYVSVQQFYLLFDRIIGTRSLQIVPLYCVSLLFKEKTAILQAKTQSQIEQILEESMDEDIFIETIREFFKYHL